MNNFCTKSNTASQTELSAKVNKPDLTAQSNINNEQAYQEQAYTELNADLRMPASARAEELCWTLSPQKGVTRKLLERVGGEKVSRATSIVRYAQGSKFNSHTHADGEEFIVLDGTFSDETGDFPKGWYVRNPPGSSHAPYSKDGCQIFVKLGQMHIFDRKSVRIDTSFANLDWQETESGAKSLKLFDNHFEHVALVHWPAGLKLDPMIFPRGLEIYVLSGRFVDEFGDHRLGTWLRIPAGHGHQPRALEDSLIYVKTGHLKSS